MEGEPAVSRNEKKERGPRQRGNRLGFWFFETALRLFGLRGAYGLLYIVCSYYLLFDRAAVRAALAYTTRRFPGDGRVRQLANAYRLFISQGKTLIDRYYLASGLGDFRVDLNGYDKVEEVLSESEQGFILLTSHVGNWQVVMTFLEKMRKRIHLLMRPEDNPAVKESLHIDGEDDMIKVISPEQFLGGVVEMMNVIKDGDVVSIMGDRSYGYSSLNVSFLGEEARFPYGAFTIAAASGRPVVVLLSAKISTRHYRIDIVDVLRPGYKGRKNKEEQLKVWVQQYAALVEAYLQAYPFQCFLFHDIWNRRRPSSSKLPAEQSDTRTKDRD